ncbi:S1 family peptidase [Photobacterium nomapromontoriensis]|uniref:S1 family peptidase n=1 Tax=Photobacterium nomapromontoriensis TaxID=2910237 RepID=UPI003D0C57DA
MHKLLFVLFFWSVSLPSLASDDVPGFQPRIIGGIESTSGELPWQAYINMTFRVNNDERTFICGGVVISPDVIITAAHCMRNGSTTVAPDDVMVWAGITSIFSANRASSVAVREIVIHPAYNLSRFANDIAILKLSGPLPNSALPIMLASSRDQERVDLAFANGWVDNGERVANLLVSGWGTTQLNESNSGATRLRQTLLSGMPDSRCDSLWGGNIRQGDHAIFLCAGSVSPDLARDSCFGDSGGPLVWQDPQSVGDRDFGLRLVGLVSFGEGCAGRLPGVYTEVAHYRSWIESEVGGGVLTQPAPDFTINPFVSDYTGAGEDVIVIPPGSDRSGGLSMGWGGLFTLVLLGIIRKRLNGE